MRREPQSAEVLRRLAVGNEHAVASALSSDGAELGDKIRAMLRLAALIAGDSAAASYQWTVNVARAAGTTDDEIVAVLCSIAPIVGSARVTLAAAPLSAALGYEVDVVEET